MIVSRFATWRVQRKRFPIRWLTYRRRVRDDVERIYRSQGGVLFFDEKYVAALSASAKQLEEWEIKLLVFQFGISAFITVGLISGDASISLLGISLKQVPGIKEFLLALSATLAVAIQAISHSKVLRLVVIEKLTELKTDERFLSFAKLAGPSSYQMTPYIARQYDKWIFSTIMTKSIMLAMTSLGFTLFLILFGFSIGLWIFLYIEILRQPTLGLISLMAILYSSVAYALCVLWLVRAYFPLPFRDMQELQELEALKLGDPAAYSAALRKLYG
jgi:hypothetical protein